MVDVQESRPPVLLLMGPTAAGKSDLAIQLASALPFGIISVDSAMVYRGMDIGTAKPGREILARIPHRLIDILDPAESYSAARFRVDALSEIEALHRRQQIPLLVGGTMLYFRTLERGLSCLPQADPAIREQLRNRHRHLGLRALHQQLAEFDPDAARRIHPHDTQRILRAIEIYESSGRTATELYTQATDEFFPYRTLKVVVAPSDRTLLHRRIAERFRIMLADGFIGEVISLKERGDLDLEKPAMRAVGYRQIWQYLAGQLSHDEMVERAVVATRQFAKRQFTWLRSVNDALWLDSSTPGLRDQVMQLLHDRSFFR